MQRNVLVESLLADGGQWYENDPAKVPEEYRHMVGLSGFRQAMTELRELSREHGFEIIVGADAPVPDAIIAICADVGLTIVNSYEGIMAFMREKGIENRGGSILTVSNDDMHPSVLAHEIMAHYFFRYFEEHIVKIYL